MSEITTGAVSLSAIGAPLAVGAACASAVNYAAKFCKNKYENLLQEIDATDERLKWVNAQVFSSPKQIEAEVKALQKIVLSTNAFHRMTREMDEAEKHSLSGVIATQNSPISCYLSPLLNEIPTTKADFNASLEQAVKNLAFDNLKFVNGIVKDAALASGFNKVIKILKQNERVLDIVFEDEKNRRFTAYCKLDKELNPSLALDLEGFACNNEECSIKMEKIVRYLQDHGVPFQYKRLRHNQPQGVLRTLLLKKEKQLNMESDNYLQSADSLSQIKNKKGI